MPDQRVDGFGWGDAVGWKRWRIRNTDHINLKGKKAQKKHLCFFSPLHLHHASQPGPGGLLGWG